MTARPQLDLLSARDVVELLLNAEARVVDAVRRAAPRIAQAADLVADRLGAGGRVLFAGAGTSGRIAAAEAAELPGTFGLHRGRVRACVAGGADSTDADEDDLAAARADAAELAPSDMDVLIALAASGATPYTLAMARAARGARAAVVGVVCVADSPLAALADIAVEVTVGAEVLRGSSRLTAGTAQKVTLNALSTAAMARLGRVHGDLMVDVVGANAKLRDRQAAIVAEISGSSLEASRRAVEACAGDARAAVLHLVTGVPSAEARRRAAQHRTLRDALGSRSGNEAAPGN